MWQRLQPLQWSAESCTRHSKRCTELKLCGPHAAHYESTRNLMSYVTQFKSTRRRLCRWQLRASGVCFCSLIFFPITSSSAIQNNKAVVVGARSTITRTKARITVDGILNEPDWIEAQPVGEILQRDPHPGEKASEKTDVKLLYDDDDL